MMGGVLSHVCDNDTLVHDLGINKKKIVLL